MDSDELGANILNYLESDNSMSLATVDDDLPEALARKGSIFENILYRQLAELWPQAKVGNQLSDITQETP